MKKLTDKTKYELRDGHAVIFACLKGTTKFVPAFVCHTSCISVIQAANSIRADNVVLKPYQEEFHS